MPVNPASSPADADRPPARSSWRPEWLNDDLLYLLIGRALRSLAQSFLLIILPLYITILGFSAERLGILLGASSVTSALLIVATGPLADRFGRKTMLMIISLMMTGGGLVFALSTNFFVLAAGAALGTIGRGGGVGSGGAFGPYYPAEQPLIAEHGSDHQRTMIFGVLSFVGVVASAVGSLFSWIPQLLAKTSLFSVPDGYRMLFLLSAGFGIAMTLVVIPVHESHRHVRHVPHPRRADPDGTISHRRILGVWISHESWRLIGRFMITNSINGLAVGMLGPFVVYWFHRRYGVDAASIGTLFFFINIIAALPYLLAGRLARRLGAVSAVVVTRTVSVVLLMVLALMPTFLLASLVFGIRTIFNTLSLPVRQSYLMGIIPPSERSSAAGFSNFPSMAASSISPYFAGYAMEHLALSIPLEAAAVLMGLNTLLYHFLFRNIRPPEEK